MTFEEKIQSLSDRIERNNSWRQKECINLIPSETTPSLLVKMCEISDPAGRYAEHRTMKGQEIYFYQGTDFIRDVEEELLNEDIDIVDLNEDTNFMQIFIIVVFVLFLVTIGIVFYIKRKKPKKTELDEDLTEKVLDFIKKNNGRVTQKEIRKNFAYSEAKISLVISELEHKNKIEKIKKSKGNIIILR